MMYTKTYTSISSEDDDEQWFTIKSRIQLVIVNYFPWHIGIYLPL
uniref:Uncharacterized protein n=1 Tax=Nelumbo nucifera TaxID=4432 RepID=A0A822ZPR7_NELNU|nr:TPA_asm: hypothetical protein HUJ06_017911 [Nelumbo nucifera]